MPFIGNIRKHLNLCAHGEAYMSKEQEGRPKPP